MRADRPTHSPDGVLLDLFGVPVMKFCLLCENGLSPLPVGTRAFQWRAPKWPVGEKGFASWPCVLTWQAPAAHRTGVRTFFHTRLLQHTELCQCPAPTGRAARSSQRQAACSTLKPSPPAPSGQFCNRMLLVRHLTRMAFPGTLEGGYSKVQISSKFCWPGTKQLLCHSESLCSVSWGWWVGRSFSLGVLSQPWSSGCNL